MIKKIILIALLAVVVGSIASLASLFFVWLVRLANQYLFVHPESRNFADDSPWLLLLIILIPAMGGLAVGFISSATREKRPLTLVDSIRTAQTLKFDQPLKSGLLSALSAIAALGSGAPLGQYSPLAHLGSTLGTAVTRLMRVTGFTATMGLGCGAAAAISTTFNAPIAGLIFAHEVILRHYSLRTFAPVTVASVAGYLFANYVFDYPALFAVEITNDIHVGEYLIFMLIGIFGAYIAAALIKSVLVADGISDRTALPEFLKPALAGLVTGVVAVWIPEVLGIGESVIRSAVSGQVFSMEYIVLILIAKLLLAALCLGFKMAGGIFSPSLVIGILFGALIGEISSILLAENFSGIAGYAICGMVAVASPVMGAPLTAILIVFELTRNYDLAIAAMISAVLSNLVGYRLVGRSLFDLQLGQSGFDLKLGRDKVVMQEYGIENHIQNTYVSVSEKETMQNLRHKLIECGQTEACVTDDEDRYCGTVSLLKILECDNKGMNSDTRCGLLAAKESIVLYRNSTIWDAMEKIQDFIGESIPVIDDPESRRLVGVVYESSIIRAYMERLEKIREEEYGARDL